MAAFIGASSANTKRVVAATEFRKMKKQYAEGNKGRKTSHFRKGKTGGWRAMFTDGESQLFDEAMATHGKGLPIYQA